MRRSFPRATLGAAACTALVLGGLGLVTAGPATAAGRSHRVADAWSAPDANSAATGANTGEHAITTRTVRRLHRRWSITSTVTAAPAIVGGHVFHVLNPSNANQHSTLVVSAATSGRTLWRARIGNRAEYYDGTTVVGDIALMPFVGAGYGRRGGVSAVDLRTHRMIWNHECPAPRHDPLKYATLGGPIVADSHDTVELASGNVLCTFATRTGRSLWHDDARDSFGGLALAHGRLYLTGGTPGLQVLRAATGSRLWSGPVGQTSPVIVNDRVIAASYSGIVAYRAGGCGRSHCRPLWQHTIDGGQATYIELGAAADGTFFATTTLANDSTGRLERFALTSGREQWTSGVLSQGLTSPVRVANTVWIVDDASQLDAWSVTARSRTPLRTISEGSDGDSDLQGIAAADGTLAVNIWPAAILGFRV